jgi:predicted lysophospholipase L1 biosynthesis ABC-type transport system permease subunit
MEILEGAPWLTVIGVVSDVRHWGYENEPEPEMFVLYRQVPSWASAMVMVARGAEGVPVAATVSAVERAVRELDPEIAADVAALEAQVDGLVAQRRFALAALGGFALLSLVLAAIGIYGMLSFAVARRTREIGIRAALGAGRPGILGLMLRTALAVVAVGMLLGGVAAFWLTQLMRTMLVEIEPRDPLSFSLSAAVLLAIATAAAALPAWRAARIDPLEALRSAEA